MPRLATTERAAADWSDGPIKMLEILILSFIKIVFVLTGVLITVMYLVLLERKVQAWVQVRLGPMRVGPHGVLQPIADVLRLFVKEDITPVRADKWLYTLSPVMRR